MRSILITLAIFLLSACSSSDGAASRSLIFVSNVDSDEISVIDPLTLEVVTLSDAALSFSLNEPRNLASNSTGSLVYVPGRFSDNVIVLNPSTPAFEQEIGSLDFDEPYAVAFASDEAWVVNKQGGGSSTGSVTIINTQTHEVETTINDTTFSSPEGITIANGKAYVANRGNGSVSILSISSRLVLDTMMVGGEPRYATATPNGQFVFIANSSGLLTKIRTSDDAVVATIDVYGCRNLGMSPDGSKLYAGTQSNSISIVNVSSSAITTLTIPGAFSVYGVAIDGSGNRGFATDESRDVVYVFDARADTLLLSDDAPLEIAVGSTPRAIIAN